MRKLGKKESIKETVESYKPYCRDCACYCQDYDYTYDRRYIEKADEGYFPPDPL